MAKRVVNLNMKDVSVGGVIPEGEYIVTVDEVSVEESQQGNQYLKWVFKVIEGPQKNSKIYHNTSLLPQSLFNLKNLLIALGVPVPDKAFQLNLDECEGCNCGVTVTHETYDGKKRSRVTDVFPLDASDVEGEDDGEEVDLEEMSLEELIEFADENDIKLTAKQKKRKSAALAAIQDALGDDDEDEEADDEEADDEDTESEEESDEDEEEEPALEDMDLEALIEFAEENEIKLTAKQKKRKSAALAAIQEALDDTDEEEEEDEDEDEEADEVDVFTLNLSECRSFAKDNGISLAKMPVKDRKNLDKVREYIQEKLDEAI
jgi:midasin, putative